MKPTVALQENTSGFRQSPDCVHEGGFLCGGDPLTGDSMRWLPHCPWGLLLTAPTSLPKTILEWVSFQKAL